MTNLKIFFDNQPQSPIFESDKLTDIADKLQNVGIRFEQWETIDNLEFGTPQETVLKAYQKDVDKLIQEEGYLTVDVVSLSSDNPDKVTLRQKFLNEHTHSEDEVRFFVAGKGLFSLHIDNQVFEVVCTQGDLISVPANTRHWFDMGANPNFIAIRFFNNPKGWVANFTGSDIASNFSRLEN
jgi:1,2-dihydroxy-3-keto-5-methylthiopentene dioxygenase